MMQIVFFSSMRNAYAKSVSNKKNENEIQEMKSLFPVEPLRIEKSKFRSSIAHL